MALMTAAEYRESLDDGRQVWIEGERVKSVPKHPAIAPMVETIARIYELHSSEEHRDKLTYTDENGELCSRFYKLPTSPEDLAARRRMTMCVLDEVSPVIDRFGDETVSPLFALYDNKELLDRYDRRYHANVAAWLKRLQRENLFMSSGNTDPKGDRSKHPHEQKNPDAYLRVVAERDDGIVINGAKFETGASYAHVAFLKPTVGRWMKESADYAVSCVVSMSAPGVRHICRAPLPRQSDGFSSPLAQRFDEIDTLLVFDNVLVPWENVLFSRQPELADLIRSTLSIWGGHGFLLRASAKADVLVGAACLVLEQTRLSQVPAVREKLAMLMMYAQAIRAFVLAAEAACQKTQSGLYMPDQAIQNAGRMFATSNYYEAVQILRDLAGGATILAPDMATFKSPETGPYVEKYFSIDDVTAEERLRALHLVSELTTSAFAGRSQLYQMFAESPLMAQAAGLYSTYDRKGAMARAASLAGIEI